MIRMSARDYAQNEINNLYRLFRTYTGHQLSFAYFLFVFFPQREAQIA